MLRRDLDKIYRNNIQLEIRTDSLQWFGVVRNASSTTERRLMIHIADGRKSYNREEISTVGLVLSEHNIADGLTKENVNDALQDLLSTRFDRNPVQKFIVRTLASSLSKTGSVESSNLRVHLCALQ